MGFKFEILAAHYPFKGCYEESFQCNTVWSALMQFRKLKGQGYEIIDLHYRDFNEQYTDIWDEE